MEYAFPVESGPSLNSSNDVPHKTDTHYEEYQDWAYIDKFNEEVDIGSPKHSVPLLNCECIEHRLPQSDDLLQRFSPVVVHGF